MLPDFSRCLTEKMLTYALGRGMAPYDKPTVQAITKQLAASGYGFQTLVNEVVRSLPFQSRRGEGRRPQTQRARVWRRRRARSSAQHDPDTATPRCDATAPSSARVKTSCAARPPPPRARETAQHQKADNDEEIHNHDLGRRLSHGGQGIHGAARVHGIVSPFQQPANNEPPDGAFVIDHEHAYGWQTLRP